MEPPPLPGKNETSFTGRQMTLLLVILILAVGVGAAVWMIRTKPKAAKKPPVKKAVLVDCIRVKKGRHNIHVSAMGTVSPSAKIDLKSKVSGEVIRVSGKFIPGGFFSKNETILELDPRDYDIDILKKESLVNKAKAGLDLELGRQDVAAKELAMMQKSSGRMFEDSSLALRKPQLDQARADYDSARADLDIARLNRSRTVIKAPFNGMLLSRNTYVGAQVSALETLGVFVGTDAYWIEATVPVNRLSRISLPGANGKKGSPATALAPGSDNAFTGRVIKRVGQLNAQSRLARIIIQIDDPLNLFEKNQGVPLFIDDYVNIAIQAGTLEDAIALPRALVHEGNSVWILEDGTLTIQTIDPVWSDTRHYYIKSGLDEDTLVITSNLSGVVNGMDVQAGTITDMNPEFTEAEKP